MLNGFSEAISRALCYTAVMGAGARILMVMLAAPYAAGAAAAAFSPATLAAAAITVMRAQHSYHYVSRELAPTNGGARVTLVGDASRTEGIQRITFSKGSRTGHVTVLVVANTVYFRGDAFTLTNYMGFSATEAASDAGKWLSLAHTTQGFSTVAADVRLDSSSLAELKMPSSVRIVGGTVVRGQRVTGLRATLHHANLIGVETLYVRATGSPLPVEDKVTVRGKVAVDIVFDGWGEPVHVTAPANAISLP